MQKPVNLVDLVKSVPTSIYYLLAKFGFDTAENEYYSQFSFRTPPVPSVFEDSPVYQPASQPRTSLI